jgi:broad specificity phosphatase PhoE
MLKTRVVWVLLIVVALVAGGIAAWCVFGNHPITTVILIRHTEKNVEPDNPNPALSPDGIERAQTLVHVLGQSGISAVYATQYIRTQLTVAPVASHLGLTVTQVESGNVAELVRQIKTNHVGGTVFAAGHNNSVPAIITALGGETLPLIPEFEYDNMFIVVVQRFRKTKVIRLKYGKPSAAPGPTST